MTENIKKCWHFLEMEYNSPCNRLQRRRNVSLNETIHPREGTEGKICSLETLVQTRTIWINGSTWLGWMEAEEVNFAGSRRCGKTCIIFFKRKKAIKKNLIKTLGFVKDRGKSGRVIKDHDDLYRARTTNELLVQEIVNSTVAVVTNSIHHATKLVEARKCSNGHHRWESKIFYRC